MDIQPRLNHASPIVQRALRLRSEVVRHKAMTAVRTEDRSTPGAVQSSQRYQWQRWQKSDLSFDANGIPDHFCRG